MIALSSYAPFSRSQEVARNQLAAKQTWEPAFAEIVYFNEVEPQLISPKTHFTGKPQRPTILEMAQYAASLNDWVAIINSDIVLAAGMSRLQPALEREHVWCGISRRLEFQPNGPPRTGKLVDLGLDFFFARPSVWALVASEIPEQFVIGKQQWDTWVLSFFLVHARDYCVDATPSKLIWHPKHSSRGEFAMERPPGDTYLDRVRWPMRTLTV